MFKITSNQEIKINRGDDSGKFPLFLNQGTRLDPMRYELTPDIKITSNPESLEPIVNEDIWNKKVTEDGVYSFLYRKNITGYEDGWYLENELVNLDDYGISYKENIIPESGNQIDVHYLKEDIEIYFYIVEVNKPLEHYLVKKTFNIDGIIRTDYHIGRMKPWEDEDPNIINENGDMMLRIDAIDTRYLYDYEYNYVVKARVIDKEEHTYLTTTISNRLPFYVIDDAVDRVW